MRRVMRERCHWAGVSPADQLYHDQEWGVPLHDDQRLFEFLILEGAQAGLSWTTILNKRPAYRLAYDDFDPRKVAAFDERKQAQLLANPAIVRNRLKIQSSISNARYFLDIQDKYGSFDVFIWDFVDGSPRTNHWASMQEVPATSPESEQMSKTLKKLGFRFVGPTICYAFMQATGMVNDHTTCCFRHAEIARQYG